MRPSPLPPVNSCPPSRLQTTTPRRTVVFVHNHGQANWAQTGFSSREMEHSFLGIAQNLCGLNRTCVASGSRTFADILPRGGLLVIPPATGAYNNRKECWRAQSSSLFSIREIEAILDFLQAGGRLLAFSYRFGDSFTRTNLRDLFRPLGCLLNYDAVIDLTRLRTARPLRAWFDLPTDSLPLEWSQPGVRSVRCRAMATFTILPGASVHPLVLSPGGRCISVDRDEHRFRFGSLPIAVAGLHGGGRFALFGGPHAFEIGTFGLLGSADNAQFLRNILRWLLGDHPLARKPSPLTVLSPQVHPQLAAPAAGDQAEIECARSGLTSVLDIERVLRRTGMLKALARGDWMP